MFNIASFLVGIAFIIQGGVIFERSLTDFEMWQGFFVVLLGFFIMTVTIKSFEDGK